MRLSEPSSRFRCQGFTLVELLVVVALIVVLAGIAVMFIPNLADQKRAADGGVQAQGWLNIAKQRALRDQAPRGIRFYIYNPALNPAANPNPFLTPASLPCIEAQFIDQPDDYLGGFVQTGNLVPTANPLSTLLLVGQDPLNGQGPGGNPDLWSVLPGDYIEVSATGVVHQIASLGPQVVNAFGQMVTQLNLAWQGVPSALPASVGPTSYYRIIRQPRVSGEEKLMLPANIAVDLSTNTTFNGTAGINSSISISTDPGNANIQYLDVLFAPSGNVMGSQIGTTQIILWIRDFSIPISQGEPTLIITQTRSGLVSAAPVDMNYFQGASLSPYTFTINP